MKWESLRARAPQKQKLNNPKITFYCRKKALKNHDNPSLSTKLFASEESRELWPAAPGIPQKPLKLRKVPRKRKCRRTVKRANESTPYLIERMSQPQLCADKQQLCAAARRRGNHGQNHFLRINHTGIFFLPHAEGPQHITEPKPRPERRHRAAQTPGLLFVSRTDADDPSRSAAASILAPCPVGASRVLDCLPHMTRVFVPVISASISVNQCR